MSPVDLDEWNKDRIDINDLVEQTCDRLGVVASYVYRLDITPSDATVYCFAGKDGFCKGSKYVVMDDASPLNGEAALEPPITFKIKG